MTRKFPAPKKRPYGHGSVSFERGHYVANYKSLETARQVRKWFLTNKHAQEHLDRWYADKLTTGPLCNVARPSTGASRTDLRGPL